MTKLRRILSIDLLKLNALFLLSFGLSILVASSTAVGVVRVLSQFGMVEVAGIGMILVGAVALTTHSTGWHYAATATFLPYALAAGKYWIETNSAQPLLFSTFVLIQMVISIEVQGATRDS